MTLRKPNFIYTFDDKDISYNEENEMIFKLVKILYEIELENFQPETVLKNNKS